MRAMIEKSQSKAQATRKASSPWKSSKEFDPYQCKQCRTWQDGELLKRRYCWRRGGKRPVQFDPDIPAVRISREVLLRLLPREEPLEYLHSRVRCYGKEICPVPIAWSPDLAELLSMEADMDAWRLPPLMAASLDWPTLLLGALRHVRGVKGLIQLKSLTPSDGESDGD